MEHHSILYGPVNRLLLAILGPPPVAKFSAGWAKFLFPDGEHAWIPDTAIMVLLVTAIVAIIFPLAARHFYYHAGWAQLQADCRISSR